MSDFYVILARVFALFPYFFGLCSAASTPKGNEALPKVQIAEPA